MHNDVASSGSHIGGVFAVNLRCPQLERGQSLSESARFSQPGGCCGAKHISCDRHEATAHLVVAVSESYDV